MVELNKEKKSLSLSVYEILLAIIVVSTIFSIYTSTASDLSFRQGFAHGFVCDWQYTEGIGDSSQLEAGMENVDFYVDLDIYEPSSFCILFNQAFDRNMDAFMIVGGLN